MKILHVEARPLYRFPVAGVADGGEEARWWDVPLWNVVATGLPEALDAIIFAGGLPAVQSLTPPPAARVLAAAYIADELADFAALGFLPPAPRTGVCLLGDFFADRALRERSVAGDVAPVWSSFSSRYRWTVGVLGERDQLEVVPAGADLVDASWIVRDGLRIGGVGARRAAGGLLPALERTLGGGPDLLLLAATPQPASTSLLTRRGSGVLATQGSGTPQEQGYGGWGVIAPYGNLYLLSRTPIAPI